MFHLDRTDRVLEHPCLFLYSLPIPLYNLQSIFLCLLHLTALFQLSFDLVELHLQKFFLAAETLDRLLFLANFLV